MQTASPGKNAKQRALVEEFIAEVEGEDRDHAIWSQRFVDQRQDRPWWRGSASFSPDARWIITRNDFSPTATVWDANTGEPVGEPMRHDGEGSIAIAIFSPDCTRILTSGETACAWDAPADKPLGEPIRFEGPIEAAMFSPDGNIVQIRDAATGKLLGKSLRSDGGSLWDVDFSAAGTRIVIVGIAAPPQLWNVSKGAPQGEVIRLGYVCHTARFSAEIF